MANPVGEPLFVANLHLFNEGIYVWGRLHKKIPICQRCAWPIGWQDPWSIGSERFAVHIVMNFRIMINPQSLSFSPYIMLGGGFKYF